MTPVLGDASAVETRLRDEAGLATASGGPQNWEPLLYVCHTSLHRMVATRVDGPVQIARALLALGAGRRARSRAHARRIERSGAGGVRGSTANLDAAPAGLANHPAGFQTGSACNFTSHDLVESREVLMRARLLAFGLSVLSGTVPSAYAQGRPSTPPPAAAAVIGANDVGVIVNYTGKGVVDAGHSILLFLFSDPNVGPNSQPLGAPEIVQKNGATAVFRNVTTKPVYVFAIYNEKGTYDGKSGPPPAGTPVAMYGTAKGATAVTPGGKTPIKLTFTGERKWGQ